MSGSGVFESLLAKPAYSEYGIHLWWEKAHSACNVIYIVFLFAYGLSSVNHQPSCLPMAENNFSAYVTDNAGSFISDVCDVQAPSFGPNDVLFILIYAPLIAELFSVAWIRMFLFNPLRLFSRAETKYASLQLPLEKMKRLATEPHFQEVPKNPSSTQVHDIVILLQKCATKDKQTLFFIRECCFTFLHVLNFLFAVFYIYGWNFSARTYPYFFCTVIVQYDIIQFRCVLPTLDMTIGSFYYAVLAFSCVARICGLVLCQCLCRKNMALFLKALWARSRAEDQRQFGEFVKFVFSSEASELMKNNIALMGTNTDPKFTNMASDFVGPKFDNSKPDLEGLIRNKRWSWIVALLEKFPEPFEDLASLEKLNIKELDSDSVERSSEGEEEIENFVRSCFACCLPSGSQLLVSSSDYGTFETRRNGRSILYYALNRDPDRKTFQMRAAKQILESTRGQERVVCYNGGQVSAKEFVEMQHESDPTYPDRIRDSLLRYIESEG